MSIPTPTPTPAPMSITTTLVQSSLKTAEFLVVSDTEVVAGRYDIRVRLVKQTTIGISEVANSGETAPLKITANATKLEIPLDQNPMINGETYTATLTLYSSSASDEIIIHRTVGVIYYDARTITVDPVEIVNNPNPTYLSGTTPNLTHSTPILKADGAVIDSTDSLYKHVKLDKIKLTATALLQEDGSFIASDDYYLGAKSYAPTTTYIWDNILPSDRAYECWGSLTLETANAFTIAPNQIKPSFSFAYEFSSTDKIGYRLDAPSVTLELGDVLGVVSTNPIKILISNWDSYSTYKPDSVLLRIRATADMGPTLLFSMNKPYADIVNKTCIFTVADLASVANGNPLTNGTTYYFETVIEFTNSTLYNPSQYRSVVVADMFKDSVDAVTVASTENSWMRHNQMNDGLVVSFKKTTQFMGSTDVSFNLDKNGETSVLAEYNVLDASGNLTAWVPFSGGYIAQGDMSSIYTLVQAAASSPNTDGRYVVPKHTSSSSDGSQQDNVNIYAVIPNQNQHRLVQFRLTLQSDNSVFDVTKRTSDSFSVPTAAGYTYPFAAASVRFFPKPADHSFILDKSFIDTLDASGNALIKVAVRVPPFFSSSITTSGGTVSGTAESINYNSADYTNLTSYVPVLGNATGAAAGLSYLPTAHASFQLKVKYVYSENTSISTNESSMDVQMQGFPSNEFSLDYVRWNKDTQQLDYALYVTATSTSAYRVDGWVIYNQVSTGGDYAKIGTFLRSDGSIRKTDLAGSVPDFSDIDIKFVATRSRWLNSIATLAPIAADQTELVDGGLMDMKVTKITKVPGGLRKPVLAEIELSNIVYDVNGPANQSAILVIKFPSNANIAGVRINNGDDSLFGSTNSTNAQFLIALGNASVTKSYKIAYRYDSYASGNVTSVYSADVTLTFKTSTSSASIPVIVSKSYVDASTFTVSYTSSDASGVSDTAVLTQKVMVEQTVPTTDVAYIAPRANADSLNLSGYKGKLIKLFIRNAFITTYEFGAESGTVTQDVNRAGVDFYVAANPAIVESSFEVKSAPKTITFDVKNNGAPYFNNVLLMVAQDSTNNENDQGTFAVAMFAQGGGFALNVPVTNSLSGGTAHTLTVTATTGSGYDTVTSFKFQAASDISVATANIVAYVSNVLEGADSGADSFAVSVTPIIPPLIERAANGITIQYTGTAGAIPSSEPLFLEANPRGTGLEWFAVINNSSKSMLMDYASNLSSGLGRTYFTKDGYTVDFKNIVTTLMTDMSSLFENKTSFNEDISSWDTSNVLTMSSMFRNARAFNINIGGWNVGKVTNMSSMFETHPADPWSQFNNGGSGDIGNWNTSEVTTMARMFTSAKSFNQNISGWNVIKVTDWNSIFANAQSFNAFILTKAPLKFR